MECGRNLYRLLDCSAKKRTWERKKGHVEFWFTNKVLVPRDGGEEGVKNGVRKYVRGVTKKTRDAARIGRNAC